MDVIVFAGICTFSFCYILFLNENNNSRKKIRGEIDEIIRKINNKNNHDDHVFNTKK